MTNIDKAHAEKLRSETALTAELGSDPEAALDERQRHLTEPQWSLSDVEELAQRLDRHVANESALLAFFSFLPSVARKRFAAPRTVFREAGFGDLADQLCHVSAAGTDILGKKSDAKSAAETAIKSVKRATSLIAEANAVGERYQSAVTNLSLDLADSEINDIDSFADCHIRFPLFLLATHYWEGRWLLEMEKVLPDIDKEQKRSDKTAVIPRWHRRMMLMPCAVATFATLPGKMTCRAKRGNAFVDDYLYAFIDLLIIDEAGQVLPEIAAPSLALAKQALVVGDTRQIEPISSIPKALIFLRWDIFTSMV
jgi:hypothetical protein